MNTSLNLPMFKRRPECLLTKSIEFKEYNNPKICAFVRGIKSAAKTGKNQKPA
jgi:arginine utilization protein RocB